MARAFEAAKEGIEVLPLSRVCRDLTSIIRRQGRALLTRRGVPLAVFGPMGGVEHRTSAVGRVEKK